MALSPLGELRNGRGILQHEAIAERFTHLAMSAGFAPTTNGFLPASDANFYFAAAEPTIWPVGSNSANDSIHRSTTILLHWQVQATRRAA